MIQPETNSLPEKWTISILEMKASFVFVLLFFLLIDPVTRMNGETGILLGAFLYTLIYFVIAWFYKPGISVHIIPIISFINSLYENNFKYFLLRIAGQFAGAFGAVFLYVMATGGGNTDYSHLIKPLNPFLTGLFMGLLSQVIYFLYFFLLSPERKSTYLKVLLLSVGMGILYDLTFYLGSISLFNPFGLLFDYFLGKPDVSFFNFFTDSIIHVIVPMLFITGTHYFTTRFIVRIEN
jgi:hypothetical protein